MYWSTIFSNIMKPFKPSSTVPFNPAKLLLWMVSGLLKCNKKIMSQIMVQSCCSHKLRCNRKYYVHIWLLSQNEVYLVFPIGKIQLGCAICNILKKSNKCVLLFRSIFWQVYFCGACICIVIPSDDF